MRLVEDHGDTTYFARPRDDLRIGNSQLSRVAYGFYRGRFYTALLSMEGLIKGLINSHALLEVLRQAYGPGYCSNRFMDRYLWDGRCVLLYYDQKPISDDAMAMFQSVPLKNEKAADEKAKAREGVSDL
jgi:hypothetical protein